jgi:hypothetical protein
MGRSSSGSAAYGLISKDLSWPKWLVNHERDWTDDKQIGIDLPVIVVLDLPATFAVYILTIPARRLVGNNSEMVGRLVAKELLQQSADDGVHARRQNDNGHVVVLGPVVEFLEVWVQLHVLQQYLNTLVVWGLDA